MPTYEYECQKCGHVFEVRQSFSDAPIAKCETCNGKVRKLFSPPAILFKGSGFHCNDYKSKGGPKPSCPVDKPADAPSCPAAAEGCPGKCAAS
jgi:putative FmdB family regulatory protein